MKKMELKHMENVQGGRVSQRNCGILGLVIVGGLFGAIFSAGVGLGIAAGGVVGAASGDCF